MTSRQGINFRVKSMLSLPYFNLLTLLFPEFHKFSRVFLLRHLNVLQECLFGLVTSEFHDGDGREALQVKVGGKAAACAV